MSVAGTDPGDFARTTTGDLSGIGTGAFSIGCWIRLTADIDYYADLFHISDGNATPTAYFLVSTTTDGVTISQFASAGSPAGTVALTVNTWYWVVISRDGANNLGFRIFDDTATSTPNILDNQAGTSTENFTATYDRFGINEMNPNEGADAEFANAKVHIGVEWTDGQAWTEAQQTGIQTAGGTAWASWTLENTTTGFDDIEGTIDLTNTGMVNGATDPTQLTYPASGGLSVHLAGPGGLAGAGGLAGQHGGIAG